MEFYKSDLLYLVPIKLIHEKFQGVEDFFIIAYKMGVLNEKRCNIINKNILFSIM